MGADGITRLSAWSPLIAAAAVAVALLAGASIAFLPALALLVWSGVLFARGRSPRAPLIAAISLLLAACLIVGILGLASLGTTSDGGVTLTPG